jgi:hypothetical protein
MYTRVRHSGLALRVCDDWMVREVDATAVTSVQCQFVEPKSRTCAFDRDYALRLPSHSRPDSCWPWQSSQRVHSGPPFNVCYLKKHALDALHEVDA